jgi:quercetin dioxygenase-like cupin family protein
MSRLICPLLLLALLLPASGQAPVPVENEPRHRLKFGNRHVRVFDVLIPPGDTSLFHTHVHDGVGIKLTDAHIRDEPTGGSPDDITVMRGEVSFALRPSPLTHRVSNIGETPFRNIFIEILPPAGAPHGAAPQALVAGQTLVLENERVRISRLVLAPGQSAELHTHALRRLAVAVTEGRLAVEVPGEKAWTVEFKSGDFRWYEAGTTHALKNVGSTPFEAVDIELK